MNAASIGRRALDIFGAALELPPPDRRRWISRRCARDPLLRAEAEALLHAAARPAGILDRTSPIAMPIALTDERMQALDARYRVIRALGRGGMASVFLAHEPEHGRDVVLKVMHPGLNDAARAAQFRREIRTTAGLRHPHIVPILDSGSVQGLPYYVMPWLHGDTLRVLLRRPIGVGAGFRILRGICAALACAHEAGVAHRDVKPENVLVVHGHAYLLDFGIACALGEPWPDTPACAAGTRGYMAPERVSAQCAIDARSDIYALGVLGTELLQRILAPMKGRPDRTARLRELRQLLDACRAAAPAARPGDMAAVLRWLDDAERGWQAREAA